METHHEATQDIATMQAALGSRAAAHAGLGIRVQLRYASFHRRCVLRHLRGGHLLEICEGSTLSATVNLNNVPLLDDAVISYLEQGCVPGGSTRNWESILQHVSGTDLQSQTLLCDPQTSGGLLVAVKPDCADAVSALLKAAGCHHLPVGTLFASGDGATIQVVS